MRNRESKEPNVMQDFGAQVTQRKKKRDVVRKVKYYIQTEDNEKTI